MANIKLCNLLSLLFAILLSAFVIQGFRAQIALPYNRRFSDSSPSHLKGSNEEKISRNSRRLMIGSTAPTCTYNECRGCKYKCRAEQVPVEGNDPINSSYHYKCVCHSLHLGRINFQLFDYKATLMAKIN
ncbi:EPIDERMAL PATTERNING FACTOR-like protein 9 isoform X2 [Mangifera indica]|uniref:EPIDERMAL PATTERNING FACTOR-like protein 9 isoform X2 n=1 Tax=Mangifera indica TaxID=29780 RepID=UPI001CFA8D74|nr:EPIDERMAL PATTERNING FACTOR-like protein 9 isoform X2 [Mangifera indica]